jgi:hypothetical protein
MLCVVITTVTAPTLENEVEYCLVMMDFNTIVSTAVSKQDGVLVDF